MFYILYRNTYICFTNYIQMSKNYLGEFEELILTMVGILEKEAYGNAIVERIGKELDRKVNLSAVHITLYRLEDKGLVSSEMSGATATRGGRRKRYFQITNAGIAQIQKLQGQRQQLWGLLPEF